MQFKGIWWLNAIGLESNEFDGKSLISACMGTGAALVGLYPNDLLKKRWDELPKVISPKLIRAVLLIVRKQHYR